MEIVVKPSRNPQPITATQLSIGRVYKMDGSDTYVMKVDLEGAGTRVIFLKSGMMVSSPATYRYWAVEAVLTVS